MGRHEELKSAFCILTHMLLELITHCPLCPGFLSKERVKANCDLVVVVRHWGAFGHHLERLQCLQKTSGGENSRLGLPRSAPMWSFILSVFTFGAS